MIAGRYRILRAIKSGGMGSVYLAQDQRLGDGLCAVKAILEAVKGDPVIARKFESEAQILSQLQHPGIPAVRDYFIEAETAYIVMDYVEGDNLELEGGEVRPVEEVIAVALELLDILGYLHQLQPPVIHCDIKPANLIREKKGGRIKLVDFGLARCLSDQKTQTVAGTLGFSALEQLRGHAEPRSDLYALGISMFYLLTGQTPTFLLVPPIREIRPELDPRLAEVIDSATRMEVEQRPHNARAMSEALGRYLDKKDQPPSKAELSSTRAQLSPLQRLKLLIQPPVKSAVPLESCPACARCVQPVDQLCRACGHSLVGEAFHFKGWRFRPAPGGPLLQGLLLMLMVETLNHLGWRMRSPWTGLSWLFWLILSLIWTGYALTVTAHRIQSNQPELPAWGNGLFHLKRGLSALALALLMVGLPSLPVLPLLWLSQSGLRSSDPSGQLLFLVVSTCLGGLLVALNFRQLTLWPWAWATLAETNHIPSALDRLAQVRREPTRLKGRLPLQIVHAIFWWLLGALLGWLWWPLASLAHCLGVLACADLAGAALKPFFARQLPDWPGSYRCLWGGGWRPFREKPRGPAAWLWLGLGLPFLGLLLMGWALPARDRHLFPYLASNQRLGFLNGNGLVLIPPRFSGAFPFEAEQNLSPACQASSWGYLGRDGRWQIPPTFEEAYPFTKDGLARVKLGGLYGFIDPQGRQVIKPAYMIARDFSEGLALVHTDKNSCGFVDKTGAWVIRPRPQGLDPGSFHSGLARVVSAETSYGYRHTYGFIETDGTLAFNRDLAGAGDFEGDLAPVEIKGRAALINRQGFVTELKCSRVFNFSEGLARFEEGGQWGFLDGSGRVVIPASYSWAYPFQGGLAAVQEGEQGSYILPDGRAAFPEKFDRALPFHNGLALVVKDPWLGYINKKCEWVWRVRCRASPSELDALLAALQPSPDLFGTHRLPGAQ